MRARERTLDGRGRQRRAVREAHPGAQAQSRPKASVEELPFLGQTGGQAALAVRGQERFEDASEHLLFLDRLRNGRLVRGSRARHRHHEASARHERHRLFLFHRRKAVELRLVGGGSLVLAAKVRDGDREGQELAQLRAAAGRGRRLDAALHPAARLVRAPAVPCGLRRSEGGGHGAFEPLLLLENLDGKLRLVDRTVEAACHLGGLREEEPRLALQRPVPAPAFVLEEFQGRLGGAGRLLGTERFQGPLGESQAVLDRLLRHISLGEVVDELGVDELEAVGVLRLEDLGIPPMQ